MTIPNIFRNAYRPALTSTIALVAMATACATTVPPELTAARTSYTRASAGPAAQLMPADLHNAKVALDQAEQSFAAEKSTQKTVDLAYIADRTAQLAEARAAAASAEKRTAQAKQALGDKQAVIATRTNAELSTTRDQLAAAQRGQEQQSQQASVDRTARRDAEEKADVSAGKVAAAEQKAVVADQRTAAADQRVTDANEALARLEAKED